MYSQAHGGKQVFQNLSFYLDFHLNTEILSAAQILLFSLISSLRYFQENVHQISKSKLS